MSGSVSVSVSVSYAIFGNPVSHSLSPQLHQSFASQFGFKIQYQKILVELGQFKKAVDDFRLQGGLGANITSPFKIEAFLYADELTDRAKLSGAVNTFIFKNNICIGDNTDGIGLIRDLKNHTIHLFQKNIVILGAGGAARSILGEIIREKPRNIFIYNRTREKTHSLIEFFQSDVLREWESARECDLIINATTITVQSEFNLSLDLTNTIGYDLNYGEKHHAFYEYAKSHHALKIIDGLGMLMAQGAENFYQWFDRMPQRIDLTHSSGKNLH